MNKKEIIEKIIKEIMEFEFRDSFPVDEYLDDVLLASQKVKEWQELLYKVYD